MALQVQYSTQEWSPSCRLPISCKLHISGHVGDVSRSLPIINTYEKPGPIFAEPRVVISGSPSVWRGPGDGRKPYGPISCKLPISSLVTARTTLMHWHWTPVICIAMSTEHGSLHLLWRNRLRPKSANLASSVLHCSRQSQTSMDSWTSTEDNCSICCQLIAFCLLSFFTPKANNVSALFQASREREQTHWILSDILVPIK